jgi:hypothetical protein
LSPKSRRIFTPRPAGIPDRKDGAYWRGERAEAIVSVRAAERAATKTVRRTRSGAASKPSRTLRRLERALKRRKTLAARLRLKRRIKLLRAELGA